MASEYLNKSFVSEKAFSDTFSRQYGPRAVQNGLNFKKFGILMFPGIQMVGIQIPLHKIAITDTNGCLFVVCCWIFEVLSPD